VRARPAVLAMQGVLLAGLVAGPLAYAHAAKSVTLDVDGHVSQIRTFAGSVGDLLKAENVVLGVRDSVAPPTSTALTVDLRIAVIHARPVTLVFAGVKRQVWTTAQTVDEFSRQLGDRFSAAYLSVSRDARIPLTGMVMVVRLPVSVTVVYAGHRVTLVTTQPTWAKALAEAGIPFSPLSQLSVRLDSAPVSGQRAVITMVRSKVVARPVTIAFSVRYSADAGLYKGTSRVVSNGVAGVRMQTWRYTLYDSKVARAQLVRSVISKQPVAEIVAVGTRPRPVPRPRPHKVLSGGVSGLNWSALAACESGGNPRAVGGGGLYFGLYQFMLSTWHGLGGSGNPIDASASEQTHRAQLLYLRSGAASWPYCGSRLTG
jgi:resuscitation-promoting factor RpfB